jgi:hypothetical protein
MQDDSHALATRPPPVPPAGDGAPSPSPPPPLVALDYQPPQPARSRSDMGWGLLISFCLAMGAGWFTFGALMMTGQRDDNAAPIAVGVAFLTLGAGVAGSLAWTRRQ